LLSAERKQKLGSFRMIYHVHITREALKVLQIPLQQVFHNFEDPLCQSGAPNAVFLLPRLLVAVPRPRDAVTRFDTLAPRPRVEAGTPPSFGQAAHISVAKLCQRSKSRTIAPMSRLVTLEASIRAAHIRCGTFALGLILAGTVCRDNNVTCSMAPSQYHSLLL
jgi:hypothetical protein